LCKNQRAGDEVEGWLHYLSNGTDDALSWIPLEFCCALLEIADKCPVHRTLTSEIRIVTRAAD
jgi:hypothetical protein